MGRVFPHLTTSNLQAPAGILESESESRSVVSYSLWPLGLYSPWNSPGQNTGVGSLSLLQGIFPTQGLNPSLLHCRWMKFNPILTLSTQRQQQIPQVKGSVLQEHRILQTSIASPGYYLCSWQAGYKLEVPMTYLLRLQTPVTSALLLTYWL